MATQNGNAKQTDKQKKSTKLDKQQAEQTLVVIKNKIINHFENNKTNVQNLLDDNGSFFDANAKAIVASTIKELAPVYTKANKKIQEIQTYYRSLDNNNFKREMKTLFKDELVNTDVILKMKDQQEQKIKQAGLMIELLQLKMDLQTFEVRALETIKKEAESRTLVVAPSFKGISNSQEIDDDVVYEDEPIQALKKQKTETKTKDTSAPAPAPAPAKPSAKVQPQSQAPRPLLSLIGAMEQNPLFLKRKKENQE